MKPVASWIGRSGGNIGSIQHQVPHWKIGVQNPYQGAFDHPRVLYVSLHNHVANTFFQKLSQLNKPL
jgi:hypothetical protein